jgi:hypothetical protein
MRRFPRPAAIAVTCLPALLALLGAGSARAAEAGGCRGANKYITRADTPKYVFSSSSSLRRMTFTYSENYWPAGTCLTLQPTSQQKGKWATAYDSLKLVHTMQAGFVAHPINFQQTTVPWSGSATPVYYWVSLADVDAAPAQ